jgi:hypothetical protein
MATKADFTEQEWQLLEQGAAGAGMYVATSEPGFWDSFKEASALAKHLADAHAHNDNELVRELAKSHDRPFGATDSPAEIQEKTVATLSEAVQALTEKAPDDLPAYRKFVLDVAQSVADAAKGVGSKETEALDQIKAALG